MKEKSKENKFIGIFSNESVKKLEQIIILSILFKYFNLILNITYACKKLQI